MAAAAAASEMLLSELSLLLGVAGLRDAFCFWLWALLRRFWRRALQVLLRGKGQAAACVHT